MNISLRKASALQNAIQETLRTIKVAPAITVSEYVDAFNTITEANKEFVANDHRRVALSVAYYNIRSLVAAANVSCGISMQLATAAFVDKRIAQVQEMLTIGPRDIDTVNKKLEKIRTQDNNARMYGREDSVMTSVLTHDQLAQLKGELLKYKKQKQSINDTILELNIKTEIPLGDNTIATLTAEDLI
jgi:hypothetical protein